MVARVSPGTGQTKSNGAYLSLRYLVGERNEGARPRERIGLIRPVWRLIIYIFRGDPVEGNVYEAVIANE
jgi:hypothetical protein